MTTFRTLFGCDLRTLALFRIGLGLALIVDLLSRVRDLRAHYTYFGVVPSPTGPETWIQEIVHLFIGATWFQAFVFLLTGVMALALVLGYHTRFATILCWGLLFFIQKRNGLLIQGNDNFLLLLFFWSIFLPLGARYSLDVAVAKIQKDDTSNAYFSMATVAILLQVAFLYFFSVFQKNAPEWIPDGTALYYAFHIDSYVLPIGVWLLNFPVVLQGLTYFTWILELIGPLLLFSPWLFLPLRLTMVLLFVLLHLGIVACLNVGIFPLINFVSLVLFLPSWCWDKLTPLLHTPARQGLTIFYDRDCEFCRKICLIVRMFFMLPHATIIPAQQDPHVLEMMERDTTWVVRDWQGHYFTQWDAMLLLVRHSPIVWPLSGLLSLSLLHKTGTKVYRMIASNRGALSRVTHFVLPSHRHDLALPRMMEWVVGFLALYMLFINVRTLPALPSPIPDPIAKMRSTLGLYQKWNMFAPHPRKSYGWLVIPGVLIDGTDVDVYNFRMTPPALEDSSLAHSPYANNRWRKYLGRIARKKEVDFRQPYARYLCRVWNESHPPLQHLLFLKMYYFRVKTLPPNSTSVAKPEEYLLLEHSCLKDSK